MPRKIICILKTPPITAIILPSTRASQGSFPAVLEDRALQTSCSGEGAGGGVSHGGAVEVAGRGEGEGGGTGALGVLADVF